MRVLFIPCGKKPEVREIDGSLESMQQLVGGLIQAVYPFDDPVALICNDEGKLMGLPLNRALRDDNGQIYDVVAGTFLIAGLSEDNFASLSPELIAKYEKRFKYPEMFIPFDGKLAVVPVKENTIRNRIKSNFER